MRVVSCPKCRIELDLDPEDAGHLVECPACLGKFTAPADPRPIPVLPPAAPNALDPTAKPSIRPQWRDNDGDDRPSRRNRSRDETFDDSPKAVVHRAQARLATAGGGLQVLGWIDVGAGVIGLIIGLVIFAVSWNKGGNDYVLAGFSVGLGLSGVVIGGLKAFGGAAMKQARNRSLAVLAAVAGCIPLNINPCMSWLLFPTYILSFIFGVMAMAVLFNRDVKKAFEITRPDGDADAMG